MSRPHTGRSRNPVARQAILDAAVAEAREHGVAAMTVEGIATRARAGKQTIYKWWPSKFHVLLDVVLTTANADIPEDDYGSLREDLRHFLAATLEHAVDRTVLLALMAQALLDPEIATTLRSGLLEQRREALRRILRRAVTRGEITGDEDLELIVDVVHGVLWHRLQLGEGRVTAETADELATFVTRATSVI